MSVKKSLYIFFTIAAISLFFVETLQALPKTTERVSLRSILDSLLVASDTLSFAEDSAVTADSLALSDSLIVADSIKNMSSIDEPVFSTARDSIVEEYVEGKRMIYFYGDISVKHKNMEIKADYMAYDVNSKTVFAKGLPDSTGAIVGQPEMLDKGKSYKMENVYYNFDTEKSKIKNMITQEGDGYIHGRFLKKMPDNSINISQGKYTTCDYEHPHFYVKMSAAKLITGGDKGRTVFGPSHVVLEDVPLPLFIPFGFVPQMGGRSSGLLMPSYGEETARGFFMRGIGYYFVFGEHFDLAATADIYTRGSWGVQLNSRYNKRYKYGGNFSMNYS